MTQVSDKLWEIVDQVRRALSLADDFTLREYGRALTKAEVDMVVEAVRRHHLPGRGFH